jgi:hypothetical protein
MPSSRQTLAPTNFKTHKLRGEWAELRFMTRAAEHGLTVSKPWGDSAPYDLMVEHHGQVLRIQVKSTTCMRDNCYKCHVASNGVPYPKDSLDFIAAAACPERSRRIIPADTWYIVPVTAVGSQAHLLLAPHRKNSKYDRYKEAWHLLL